jgi:hypothetical protein
MEQNGLDNAFPLRKRSLKIKICQMFKCLTKCNLRVAFAELMDEHSVGRLLKANCGKIVAFAVPADTADFLQKR